MDVRTRGFCRGPPRRRRGWSLSLKLGEVSAKLSHLLHQEVLGHLEESHISNEGLFHPRNGERRFLKGPHKSTLKVQGLSGHLAHDASPLAHSLAKWPGSKSPRLCSVLQVTARFLFLS